MLQGFLLTLVVIGAFKFGGYLLTIPPPPEEPETKGMQDVCGNAPNPKDPAKFSAAKALFLDNCASCHSLFKDMTGPLLMNVQQRVEKKVIYAWIRNPAAVLKSGDPYFNGLKQKFGGAMMTGFPNLTDGEIDAILEYISAYSASRPVAAN